MHILAVNDDGIDSPGLELLARTMAEYGKVSVVGPHTQQSAIGHGITIHEPIRLHHREDLLPGMDSWSLEAKPADCVKFALYALNLDIDLVVSGINDGPNLGTDIIYSGTMAGASEGIICGIPALAVSTDFSNLGIAERELAPLIRGIMDAGVLNDEAVLNINFPRKDYESSRGVKISVMGKRPFLHDFVEENGVYWSRGDWDIAENGPDTDVWAWENGFLSITPIQINRTSERHRESLSRTLPDVLRGRE
jgi:5'-nucleotidase